MKIITNGYKIPELDDKNFWDSYNFDITRLANHQHNGESGSKLDPASTEPFIEPVDPGSWTPVSNYYEAEVLFPVNVQFSDGPPMVIQFFNENDKSPILLEYGPNVTNDGIIIKSFVNEHVNVWMY